MSIHRKIIVIGTSAGGLESLRQLLSGLPEALSASIFIVQHVAAGSAGLDRILNEASPLPVSLAVHDEPIETAHIYVAAPDRHLLLRQGRLVTGAGPRENRCRPAIDPLFRSAAVEYGPQAIGVILSGSLDDGAAGLLAIKRCGGIAVVQDPLDALYPDMPQSALDHVEVDYTTALREMPGLFQRLVDEKIPLTPNASHEPPHDLVVETRMAAESGDLDQMDEIGGLAPWVCPDCGGPLWKSKPPSMERFRCHNGHAYTGRALVSEMSAATERALWTALRTMEERTRMLERLAKQAEERGQTYASKRFASHADESKRDACMIRELLVQ